jgi:3-hydroxybutyrate dehydrogenase
MQISGPSDTALRVRKLTIKVRSQPARDVRNLAGRAVFLASEAAAWITGTALPLDGGWTAH